ncbi:MAG: hypothetical protein BGO69_17545 [Bacteroidetes bacterium 46-16]|nr:MAG: hypothetical protein BGO69_17545 [Bacteroidetes bacterium 46-16]
MKPIRITIIFFSFFLLCSFSADPDTISLTGHLKTKAKKDAPTPDGIYICAKEGENLAGETETDEDGNFSIDIERQDGGKTPISIYYVNEKSDTILLKKVAHFSSDSPELTFYIK